MATSGICSDCAFPPPPSPSPPLLLLLLLLLLVLLMHCSLFHCSFLRKGDTSTR
jgi:MYXO-CTERM domain-containing protein